MNLVGKLSLIILLPSFGLFSACAPNNQVQFSATRPALDESQSGVWTGYWVQNDEKGEMELDIEIKDNKISGHGTDRIGTFTLEGDYDDQGSVKISKIYTGAHTVVYTGLYADDVIIGEWKIFAQEGLSDFQVGTFQLNWNQG